MQRVAIARALANDPEILLCDEPTGALDSTTSVQIMDLIKEVAKDRLVIMVTHNPELADEYADRIIKFSDGKIVSDTNPYENQIKKDEFKLKKTSMSVLTALRLSFNNLRTKKGRTFLTAFASSIGIVGIAVILSLSTGFQSEIDDFQSDAMAEFPIMISSQSAEVSEEAMASSQSDVANRIYGTSEYKDTKGVVITDKTEGITIHKNEFSEEFMTYINNIPSKICGSIGKVRITNMNIVRKDGENYIPASFASVANSEQNSNNMMGSNTSTMGISAYPDSLGKNANYLEDNY